MTKQELKITMSKILNTHINKLDTNQNAKDYLKNTLLHSLNETIDEMKQVEFDSKFNTTKFIKNIESKL